MKEPTRGVRRTPTGDSINFGLMLAGEDIDEDKESEDVKTPATPPDEIESPRRAIRRAPTGDENSFALMLGIEKDETSQNKDEASERKSVASTS